MLIGVIVSDVWGVELQSKCDYLRLYSSLVFQGERFFNRERKKILVSLTVCRKSTMIPTTLIQFIGTQKNSTVLRKLALLDYVWPVGVAL